MRREIWTPVRPDGTVDATELQRPTQMAEPTLWEVPTLPADEDSLVVLCAGCVALYRHTFWFLTSDPFRFVPLLNRGSESVVIAKNITIAAGPIRAQTEAEAMLPALLSVKAARREAVFAPVELINLEVWLSSGFRVTHDHLDAPDGARLGRLERVGERWKPRLPRPDAVRVRGETSPGARPLHPELVNKLREQAEAAGVAFEVDWGAWSPAEGEPRAGDLWLLGNGNTQRWAPGDRGAPAGRWHELPDVLMRSTLPWGGRGDPADYATPEQVAMRRAPGAAVCVDPDCTLSGGYAHVGDCEPCMCGKRHAAAECPGQARATEKGRASDEPD